MAKASINGRLKVLMNRYGDVYDIVTERFNRCLDYVCFVANVDKEVLLSQSRQYPLPDLRHIFTYLLVRKELLSRTQAGILIAVNHDVIIHSLEQAEHLMAEDYYGNIVEHYTNLSEERMNYLSMRKKYDKTP